MGRILTPKTIKSPRPTLRSSSTTTLAKLVSPAIPKIVGKDSYSNNYKMTVVGVLQGRIRRRRTRLLPENFHPIMRAGTDHRRQPGRHAQGAPQSLGQSLRPIESPASRSSKPRRLCSPSCTPCSNQQCSSPPLPTPQSTTRDEFLKCWIDVFAGSKGRSLHPPPAQTPSGLRPPRSSLVIACANSPNLIARPRFQPRKGKRRSLGGWAHQSAKHRPALDRKPFSFCPSGDFPACRLPSGLTRSHEKSISPPISGGMRHLQRARPSHSFLQMAVTVLRSHFRTRSRSSRLTKPSRWHTQGFSRRRSGSGGGHHR